MLKPEQVDWESLHHQNPLFTWSGSYGTGIIPLVTHTGQVLMGPDRFGESSPLYVYRLRENEQSIGTIISYQESLQQKKLSFHQKIHLLVRSREFFPGVNFLNLMQNLDFPSQKEGVLRFIASLESSIRENWLNRGVQALRFWEYLLFLQDYALYEIVQESLLTGQELRLLLTQLYELGQMGRIGKNDTVPVSEVSSFILRRRFPEFATMYEGFQEKRRALPVPPFVKLGPLPYFEGKKLLLEIELKNPQQLEESIQFFQNQAPALRELLSLLG